jgi:hypothetical protein
MDLAAYFSKAYEAGSGFFKGFFDKSDRLIEETGTK